MISELCNAYRKFDEGYYVKNDELNRTGCKTISLAESPWIWVVLKRRKESLHDSPISLAGGVQDGAYG